MTQDQGEADGDEQETAPEPKAEKASKVRAKAKAKSEEAGTKKVTIDGVEVELDDHIDPEQVEAFGAESRDSEELDIDELRALAEADAIYEEDDE